MAASLRHVAQGAVAAGHPETAAAAVEILQDGGTAFDAALAALCAACVAEPVLASLGGGGFLTAQKADGETAVYDFFAQVPRQRLSAAERDFRPIMADFGTAQQEFHIGLGSMAVPGVVSGLFAAHADLCRLPMARIVEPAARLARRGVTVNGLQAYIFDVVQAIYLSDPACRAQFAGASDPEKLVVEGDHLAVPALADVLEALSAEGADLFYRGDIAAQLVRDCADGGGLIGRDDLAAYATIRRQPLTLRYGGAHLAVNPPPSGGGLLIAFGLDMLDGLDLGATGFGSGDHLAALVRAQDATNRARRESGFHEGDEDAAVRRLLDPALLERYRQGVAGHPPAHRGTTQISVLDGVGNAAALTVSNGEGAGYVIPSTGIIMNNMLGEEDINPHGFHGGPTDVRMSSMMAPMVVRWDDGRRMALGSGGSNRIRTALLQVLVNVIDFGVSLSDAVDAPRLHLEGGRLSLEAGLNDPEAAVAAAPDGTEVQAWADKNLFFGGVHAAAFDAATGGFQAAGDPRRGGTGCVV